MKEAVIVAYGRSAVGKATKGFFKDTHPIDYAGMVMQGVLERLPQLNPRDIDDVIYGCAFPEQIQNYDIAKMSALRAGLPLEVPGITISRFCSSGLDAIALAAGKIVSGQADVIVAGGVESMSLTPVTIAENQWLKDNVDDAYLPVGIAGENDAIEYGVSRERMAELAVLSHNRAARAIEQKRFSNQIIPVSVTNDEGQEIMANVDEGVRPGTSMEGVMALKPLFGEGGFLNAATSSQRSDGTGCVILMTAEKAADLGIKPIARFVAAAPGAGTPHLLAPGLLNAITKVMERSSMCCADMDIIEINEAFASVLAATIDTFDLDIEKVNPNGGAMALGHPLGATGTILTCKALAELERTKGKYAMVCMCAAAGQGCAAILERI